MEKLNEVLHELGISKVKLAKYLGVSRQMIYNYLDLDDLNKWPKDKKVLLFNLLGIKSAEELDNIKVDTDYIMDVEMRINNLFENENSKVDSSTICSGLEEKERNLLLNIVDLIKEELEDSSDEEAFKKYTYLYNFIQTMSTNKELKYLLAYVSKSAGIEKPMEFAFNEEEQFIFESIMFTAMTLYEEKSHNGVSTNKLAEAHKRFVAKAEHKKEDRLSRTLELNLLKVQALKELNYDSVTLENASEVSQKMAELSSKKLN